MSNKAEQLLVLSSNFETLASKSLEKEKAKKDKKKKDLDSNKAKDSKTDSKKDSKKNSKTTSKEDSKKSKDTKKKKASEYYDRFLSKFGQDASPNYGDMTEYELAEEALKNDNPTSFLQQLVNSQRIPRPLANKALWVLRVQSGGNGPTTAPSSGTTPASTGGTSGSYPTIDPYVQKSLTQLGFDTAGTDGVLGPNTRKAIEKFKASRNMKGTDAEVFQLAKAEFQRKFPGMQTGKNDPGYSTKSVDEIPTLPPNPYDTPPKGRHDPGLGF